MENQERERFFELYYESPDPAWAIKGLQAYLARPDSNVCGESVLMPYRFGRLAQMHPEVAPTFRKATEASAGTNPEFCAALDDWLTGGTSPPRNALDIVITSPQDNDLLWTEFTLTGKPEPIIRLIDLFERTDKVRVKLMEWLSIPESILAKLFKRRVRTCESFREILDVHIDVDVGQIRSKDDLDALCFMRGDAMIDNQRFEQIGKFFPIDLSTEEVTYCLTKATAKWSLCWSAIKNERVRSIIIDQIGERSGNTLLVLLEIAARASLAMEDAAAAEDFLARFIEMNPDRMELQALCAPLVADAELASLSRLSADAIKSPSTLTKAEAKEVIQSCLNQERGVQSGFGKLNAGIRKGEVFEDAEEQKYVEWTYKFDGRGSIEVLQWMDPDDWDKWISIDQQTYQSAGLWFKTRDSRTKRQFERANSMLRNAGWLKTLETGTAISSDVYEWRDRQFLLLKYHSPLLHKVIERILPIKSTTRRRDAEVEFWIDLSSKRLVACDAYVKNAVLNLSIAHLFLHQVFALPNAVVSITHPEVMVAQPGSGIEPGTEVIMHQVPSQSKIFEAD